MLASPFEGREEIPALLCCGMMYFMLLFWRKMGVMMEKKKFWSKMFPEKERKSYHSKRIEAVGYLASGFVHEYNNMFAAILGAAEILRENVDTEQKEYVEIIIKTITRAGNLTNQLFGSARKKKIEMVAIDMHELLRSIIQIFKKNRTVNIQFYEDFKASGWNVIGDEQEIKNALVNLGINAVEAIGQARGSVYFRTKITEFHSKTNIGIFEIEAGSYFTVSIEDTGNGFSSEIMEKIFDPYFINPKKDSNPGIRLATVLAAAGHHNGAIFAQSKEDHGSQFTLYLPFSQKNPSGTNNNLEEAKQKNANDSMTIMVVDDDPFVRKVITAMLERMGYSIIVAESGEDAINIYEVRKDEIALVILDMVMSNMDGLTCFYKLKKLNDEVKVIVSSGFIDNSTIEDMKKDGLCGFITKPYSYSDLQKNVGNLLQIV
jgi:nitrogen-specific signal transduction histidine kinase/CheY-like chemotaxis protein